MSANENLDNSDKMSRDELTTQQLNTLLQKLCDSTTDGSLHWFRQQGSAHRYANWNNNLLILGPDEPQSETNAPRYLFITPFDSPAHLEIRSDDLKLGAQVLKLLALVDTVTANEPPTDPFAIDVKSLKRLFG